MHIFQQTLIDNIILDIAKKKFGAILFLIQLGTKSPVVRFVDIWPNILCFTRIK